MTREFVTNVLKPIKPFDRNFKVYKHTKKNQQSFRLTKQLLTSIYNKAEKINKSAELVITIPANAQENYILTCAIMKERKI